MAFGGGFQPDAFQLGAFQMDVPVSPGSSMSGGTFSRGKWRKIKDERDAKIQAARRQQALAQEKQKAAAAAALEAKRSETAARRAAEDASAAQGVIDRLLSSGPTLRPIDIGRHVAMLNLTRAAQERQAQEMADEEVAVIRMLMEDDG